MRNPELAEAVRAAIGEPRRALVPTGLRHAIDRGVLPADIDLEMALDLIAAPVYWRLSVRRAPAQPDYLEHHTDLVLRALKGGSS